MKRILLPFILLLFCLLSVVLPQIGAAAPAAGDPIAGWVPVESLPSGLLNGTEPNVNGLSQQVIDLVVKELGRPYGWLAYEPEATVFTRDGSGQHAFAMTVHLGVIFQGSAAELKNRAARGLFDRVLHVTVRGRQEGGGWGSVTLRLLAAPIIAVPAMPEAGPYGGAEVVRGWVIDYAGGDPAPPLGSGLRPKDAATLPPLIDQLAKYPAVVIARLDPGDSSMVLSTQPIVQGAVVAGRETDTVLIVRTVNAYKRAPWMDGLWQENFVQATGGLDDAATRAGVAPDRTGIQRVLLQRAADGTWSVAEHQIMQGGYTLTVLAPSMADRVIGTLSTVGVAVPPALRDSTPVAPVIGLVASGAAALVLMAWAAGQALSLVAGAAQLGRVAQAVQGETGTKAAKLGSDAMDWAFRPLEKPLSTLMKGASRKLGLFRYLTEAEEEEPAPVPHAPLVAKGSGHACGTCGTTAHIAWRHCTGCGVTLSGAALHVAGGEQP